MVQRLTKEAQHMVSERAERTPRRSAAAFSGVLAAVVLTAVIVVAVGGAAPKPTPPIAASSSLCKGKTFKIGSDNYGASVLNGQELAKAGKKKFGSTLPYLVVAAEPSAGPIVMQRYYGAVAGAKKVYPKLGGDHVIQVTSDGTEAGTYNNAVSAFSRIPSGAPVLTSAVNDEVSHAMYKAALARKLNFLVNSFGGDPFGLSQVCADRTHYAGALFLEPEKWGESAVATIMRMANHMPYSSNIGVTGTQVTAANPIAGCK